MRHSAAFGLLLLIAAAGLRAGAPPGTQPSNIEFLQGDAGKAAIIDDSLDPYFSLLEDHEMTAKTSSPITGDTHEAKLVECKRRYQARVVDFTDEEEKVLTSWIGKITPPLARDYPVFGDTKWSFVKTRDSLEGGMAWTHGNHIFLPQGMLSGFVETNNQLGDKALSHGAGLLIHEQTHVLERLLPQLFVPLYTETFHFVHADQLPENQLLKAHQLVNPDGTKCDWLFPANINGECFILPLLMFAEADPQNMNGIETRAVIMQRKGDGYDYCFDDGGKVRTTSLSAIRQYMDGSGAEQNNYHPNEIIADRFAELVVFDELLDADIKMKLTSGTKAKLEKRLKPICDWAKPAFADAHAK